MADKDSIVKKYAHIIDALKKSPGNEEAIDLLVRLEEDIKEYLFETLQMKQGEHRNISNTYQKFNKGNKGRDQIEGLIMNAITGDKVCVNDLADVFIKRIHETLSTSKGIEEKIRGLNIQYIHINKIILPPDHEIKLKTGSGKGRIEKKTKINKFDLLIDYFRERGIYTDDMFVMEGIVSKDMTKKQSYYCIYIPRADKTIFVNNSGGEATFVYNGILDIDRFTQLGKRGLQHVLKKIIFSEEDVNCRKQKIYASIFDNDQQKLGEKISIKEFKNKMKKSLKKQEFLELYDKLPEEEQAMIVNGKNEYFKRAKKYPEVPQYYYGLISLLGGDTKCQEGGYVQALIAGQGKEYLENREKRKNKTDEEKKQEFLELYGKLPEEEKKIVVSNVNAYFKRAKKYPEAPPSFLLLITILGGDSKCREGGYVQALIAGQGKEYLENREKRKNKTDEERKQEFLELYDKLPEEEKKMVIDSCKKYQKRAKKYPEVPKSYQGLIILLGGDSKCREGGYVQALIVGQGKEYLENREKRRINT